MDLGWIICDDTFKTMIDSLIQNGLNIMILYVSNQPKSMCVLTSSNPLNSVGIGKNSLLLDDLLQMIDDTMFDNHFVDQHMLDYSKPNENKEDDDDDDDVNADNDNDNDNNIDNETIPYVPKFKDVYRSSCIIPRGCDLKVS